MAAPINIAEFQTVSDIEAAKMLGVNFRKLRAEIDAIGCCLRIGMGPRRLTSEHMRRLVRHLEARPCFALIKDHQESGASEARTTASASTKALALAASQKRG